MAKAPCIECRVRPKWGTRHRCIVCAMRHEPIGAQVEESRRRLAMVPEPLRRSRVPERLWPEGTRWCAGCQSFVDLIDIPKGGSRCKACASAAVHGSMILKTYGLSSTEYDSLLALQGGRCAICRAKPKSKRLAVDHDHRSGLVRGLLCSRCNHDLLGSAWDSMSMALALWHYMNTPPTSGEWRSPELGLAAPGDAVRPVETSAPVSDPFSTVDLKGREVMEQAPAVTDSVGLLPAAWYSEEATVLNARMRELSGLLRRVDPAPF